MGTYDDIIDNNRNETYETESYETETYETESYETESYETETEYWDKISNISEEDEFTMCFYCNEEINVMDLPYHICSDNKPLWEYEEEEALVSEEEEDQILTETALENLENHLHNQINYDNLFPEETEYYLPETMTEDITKINKPYLDGTNNINRSNFNYPIPIFEIPDALRQRRGLLPNNFNLDSIKSANDTDIIYYDNYTKWCNIVETTVAEECGVCLHKKNKFHQFKSCLHKICEECCFKWFQDNTSCPICRSNITLVDNVIPILTSGCRKISCN